MKICFFLQGLVVVDVYSEWSGPCSAMTNFLKKIKLEVNDDLLHYAMAKSDTIPQVCLFFCLHGYVCERVSVIWLQKEVRAIPISQYKKL